MQRPFFRSPSTGAQLAFLGLLLIFCLFLSFPFLQLGARMMGYNPGVLQNLSVDQVEGHLDLFRMMQIVQSIFVFIFPPLLFAWLTSENSGHYLQLSSLPKARWIYASIVLVIIIIPALNLIAELNTRMQFPESMQSVLKWMKDKEGDAEILTNHFLGVKDFGGLFFNLFMVALLPAIGEELLFRGVLQRLLTKLFRNYHWGIWVTAFLFTALHMQFLTMVPRLLLGALFGYLLVWSGSLWLPMVAHFVNNTMAVVFYWLWTNGFTGKGIDEIGTLEQSVVPALISVVLVAVWIVWFYRDTQKFKSM